MKFCTIRDRGVGNIRPSGLVPGFIRGGILEVDFLYLGDLMLSSWADRDSFGKELNKVLSPARPI